MFSLKKILIDENQTINKALNTIKKNGLGTCFVTSKNKYKTVITDGDIRNIIISGKNLNHSIKRFFNKKKSVALHYTTSEIDIYKKLNNNIRIIPLIDSKKESVSYSTIKNLKYINLHDINLEGNEFNYVSDCLKSNWISSIGKYVELFENKFKRFFNAKYALSTSSGTTALHLALKSLDIKKGDEVILPNLTFVSPINTVITSGAKPVVLDVNPQTYTIDVRKIEKAITKKTKAIICVHLYGQPCDLDELIKIKRKYNIYLIEDCAEAIGTKYKKKHVSNFGDVSIFSFYGNKTITTGEGGMLVTNYKNIFENAKIMRSHGMRPQKRYWHDVIGYNYRMTNLQAAVGLAQMENINKIIKQKRKISEFYNSEMKKLNKKINYKIIIPYFNKKNVNSYWLYNIRIDKINSVRRDSIIKLLDRKGINTRNFFYPLSSMRIYKKYCKFSYPVSNKLSESGLCLPSSPNLSKKQAKYIIVELFNAIKTLP